MRDGLEQHAPAQALHCFERILQLAPLKDGRLQPLELLLGERDAHGLAQVDPILWTTERRI